MTRSIHIGFRKGLTLLAMTAVAVSIGGSSFVQASEYYNSSYNYDHSYYSNSYDGNHYAYNDDYFNRRTNYHATYYAQPACTIEVSRYGGNYGYERTVTITWASSNATSAYLTNVGSVGVNGSQAIYYPFNSSYTLTVYGPGGSSSCTTYTQQYTYDHSDYRSDNRYPYVYSNYVTPTYPTYTYPTYTYPTYTYPTAQASIAQTYVPLSQIPYTGFDYGILGNALYWLGIILVAAAGANFIVYQHAHRMPSAFVKEVAQAARNQYRALKTIVK